jgi:hypothetical protein
MASALDYIKGSLRKINSYQSGEPVAAPDAQDCLDTLSDLFDSWNLDKNLIFGSVENILTLNAGQAQYKIGNPSCTDLGEPPLIGTVTGGSPTITGVTTMPADITIGGTLSDTAAAIAAGTTVVGFNAGAQTVTMSKNALTTPANNPDSITYTIPGDFAIPRPNRITHGFTRYAQLDFTIEVTMSQSRFLEILYKAQPGPWPVVAWYNPLMPYGLINFYQTPGNSGELHLFTDTIIQKLTLNQTVLLPAGYARAVKWALAAELWNEYWGTTPMPAQLAKKEAESLAMIKALNATPAVKARFDRMLTRRGRVSAGWILDGGFGNS